NGGTRDGYMRVLRNLNPQYEAEAWIPAGTRLNATVRMAGLYERWCTRRARAELARTLVNSDPATAIVRVGDMETVTLPDGTVIQQSAAQTAAAPTPAPAPARPRTHRVASGETLNAIARRYSCEVRALAAANGIKPPRYALRAGQTLKLEGCRQAWGPRPLRRRGGAGAGACRSPPDMRRPIPRLFQSFRRPCFRRPRLRHPHPCLRLPLRARPTWLRAVRPWSGAARPCRAAGCCGCGSGCGSRRCRGRPG